MPIALVRKVAIPSEDPLLVVAARMEAKFRDAFLQAVQSTRDKVVLEKLRAAIAAGDPNAALAVLAVDENFVAALNGAGLESGIVNFKEAVQQTFFAGAKAAYQALPEKISVGLRFDLLNPEAVKFLESYSFDLIQQVSQNTLEAVRQTVLRAFQEGAHPFEQAREIKQVIGLTLKQEQAVQNYRNALEQGDLNAALERALRDGRFDRSVLAAIDQSRPLPAAQIDKMVARYRERFLQYRARAIARTESLRASNAGAFQLHLQARRQGMLGPKTMKRLVVSGDEKTCSICLGVRAEGPVPLERPFSTGDLFPPLHVTCRCNYSLVAGTMALAA